MRIIHSASFLITLSLVIIYFQFIAPMVYSNYFGVFDSTKMASLIFIVVYAVVGYLVLPLAIGIFLFKQKLPDLGLRLPQNNLIALLVVIISLLCLIPVMFLLSKTESFHRYYLLHISKEKFIFLTTVLTPIYYFAEEFFFRGFLFLNLWRKIRWHGLWITEVIFAIAHLFKPGLEILFAFPVGLFLNYVTVKTKSVYPSVIVHYILGLSNLLFVNL